MVTKVKAQKRGQAGGLALVDKFGTDYMRRIGQNGGLKGGAKGGRPRARTTQDVAYQLSNNQKEGLPAMSRTEMLAECKRIYPDLSCPHQNNERMDNG